MKIENEIGGQMSLTFDNKNLKEKSFLVLEKMSTGIKLLVKFKTGVALDRYLLFWQNTLGIFRIKGIAKFRFQ